MALFGKKKMVNTGEENTAKYVRRVFAEKIMFAPEQVKNYYFQIKSALTVDGGKSKLTRNADSFYYGKDKFAEITFSGKTLKLRLNLNKDKILEKYHAKELKDKNLTVYIKITSKRALKYALELISITMKEKNLTVATAQIDAMGLIEEYLINRR